MCVQVCIGEFELRAFGRCVGGVRVRVCVPACPRRVPAACLHSLAGGELEADELLVLGVDRLHVLLVLDLQLVKVHQVKHFAHLLLVCQLRLELCDRCLVGRVLERHLLQQHLLAVHLVLKEPAGKVGSGDERSQVPS